MRKNRFSKIWKLVRSPAVHHVGHKRDSTHPACMPNLSSGSEQSHPVSCEARHLELHTGAGDEPATLCSPSVFNMAHQPSHPFKRQMHQGVAAKSRDAEESATHARHQVVSIIEPLEVELPVEHHLDLANRLASRFLMAGAPFSTST